MTVPQEPRNQSYPCKAIKAVVSRVRCTLNMTACGIKAFLLFIVHPARRLAGCDTHVALFPTWTGKRLFLADFLPTTAFVVAVVLVPLSLSREYADAMAEIPLTLLIVLIALFAGGVGYINAESAQVNDKGRRLALVQTGLGILGGIGVVLAIGFQVRDVESDVAGVEQQLSTVGQRVGVVEELVRTPDFMIGDADCNGSVNSIDAAVVLQLAARQVTQIPCAGFANVNLDAFINSLDSLLILQRVADADRE